MKKCKFKVGDIVKPNKKADRYSITNRNYVAKGRVASIGNIDDDESFTLEVIEWKSKKPQGNIGNIFVAISVDCFDLVAASSTQELHVTTDGKTTYAILKENGKVVKRARADCDPRDEFDFETGARLAIDRVFGKEEKQGFKFNLGDKVTVVDSGKAYCHYVEFMKQFGDGILGRYVYSYAPKSGVTYSIVERGIHPNNNKELYVIKPDNQSLLSSSLFLISDDGLAKVKEEI